MDIEKELPESEFINEGMQKNPYPFWLWLFLLAIMISLVFGFRHWYQGYVGDQIAKTPFMQVTNREFSLFLWENPQYMRANVKTKTGYLPGFQYLDNVTIEEGAPEKNVIAPPKVIFRYHAWNRLVKNEIPPRKIAPKEFLLFLKRVPEWAPENWPEAPAGYAKVVKQLPNLSVENMQSLPEESLPHDVRAAFIGWKNYFKDKEAINEVSLTYSQLQSFLAKYPHYARNYWKNIVSEKYLHSYTLGYFAPINVVPKDEMAPFLQAAIYNELHLND